MMGARRMTALAATAVIAAAAASLLAAAVPAQAADVGLVAASTPFPTVSFTKVRSDAGFVHPGISVQASDLENTRTQVKAGVEPWASYYTAMTATKYASATFSSANVSTTGDKPANTAFNSQAVQALFIEDAFRAYTQAIQYTVTGDPAYRKNALRLIRIWSQMDPAKYAYYPDAHIHSGVPLMRILAAAELVRYSSVNAGADGYDLQWNDADTQALTKNLIDPAVSTFLYGNKRFMNQHLYSLVGATAAYIFTDNAPRYREAVEWFSVNSTNPDDYANGALNSLFRVIDKKDPLNTFGRTFVQHQEMGRDQAHGYDGVAKLSELARMLTVQGTKLDPRTGQVSTQGNALSPYTWGDNRILKGADAFYGYMMGRDIPWIDTSKRNGVLAEAYRGRQFNFLDELYETYRYKLGVDVKDEAPNVAEMAAHADGPVFYWGTGQYNFWNVNPDYNVDYWLSIPKQVAGKARPGPGTALVQLETRSIPLDRGSSTVSEGDRSFVRVPGTTATRAVRTLLYPDRNTYRPVGVLVRTNGVSKLDIRKQRALAPYETLTIPDTRGRWRYVTYDVSFASKPGAVVGENLAYYTVTAPAGVTVDLDAVNLDATALTPPRYESRAKRVVAVAGEHVSVPVTAVDQGNDALTYEASALPDGASLSQEGTLSWSPTSAQVGRHTSQVVASDGPSDAVLDLNFTVAKDRTAAIEAAVDGYDANAGYVAATKDAMSRARTQTQEVVGSATPQEFQAALAKVQAAVAGLRLLNPRLHDGTLDYTSLVSSGLSRNGVVQMADDDFNTFSGDLLAPFTFDFGSGFRVKASAFGFQARYNFANRTEGANVYGSNDGTTWTLLSARMTSNTDAQGFPLETIGVREDVKDSTFRYVKVQVDKPGIPTDPVYPGISSFAELRITGQRIETAKAITSVHIASNGADPTRAVNGDTVTVTFEANALIDQVRASIEGGEATVTHDGNRWQASRVLPHDVAYGRAARFVIDYATPDGQVGDTVTATTDQSSVQLWNTKAQPLTIDPSWVVASTGRSPLTAAQNGWRMFDGDLGTATDTTTSTGWVTVTPASSSPLVFDAVQMRARTGFAGRASGTKVQTSSDGGTTWSTVLTFPSITSDTEWYTFDLPSQVSTPLVRVLDDHGGFTNVAELRLIRYS